uniref:Chromobox 2 n=1 Tax=Pelodiscus sinensis TaxID=13735 RepID=K7F445_PELSI
TGWGEAPRQARRSGTSHCQGRAGGGEGKCPPKSSRPAALSEMSTGEEETSSDSDRDSASFPGVGQNMSVSIQTSQDWKPTRSLIEHVFVTDVTANLITVTVKESPTSVGFFNLRHY